MNLIKSEVKPGLRTLPVQRSNEKNAPEPAAAPAAAAAPLLDTEPDRLSAKDLFCLGFAFSAALLLIGGGAAASIDDNVPPQPLTSVSGR